MAGRLLRQPAHRRGEDSTGLQVQSTVWLPLDPEAVQALPQPVALQPEAVRGWPGQLRSGG
eukprot:4682316-Prorocentrum_lima.AAC.1